MEPVISLFFGYEKITLTETFFKNIVGWMDGWEGRKEMFYLNALNTFYLRLYGVGHMVKDHSDSER